jgi:hypothetical protein
MSAICDACGHGAGVDTRPLGGGFDWETPLTEV